MEGFPTKRNFPGEAGEVRSELQADAGKVKDNKRRAGQTERNERHARLKGFPNFVSSE